MLSKCLSFLNYIKEGIKMGLTHREKEILGILQQDPMVSQEELARKLDITRSAVAVHISNLIKKGKIIGRGYVLTQPKAIAILGRIVASAINKDNKLKLSINGLGYTLSTGLAELNENVIIISGLGDDFVGKSVLSQLQSDNIDKKMLVVQEKLDSAIQIITENQTIVCNNALDLITPDYLLAREHIIKQANLVIIDGTMGAKTCGTMMNIAKRNNINSVCILYDTKDITAFFKADIIKNFDTVILGKRQLTQLGVNDTQFERLIDNNFLSVHAAGKILILCEEEGVLLFNKNNIKHVSLLPGQTIKKDFIVGFIYGLSNNYPINQAIRIGMGNFQQKR